MYCECGVNEGCSRECDKDHPLYKAIKQARDIDPSSREHLLDWIVDRAASIGEKRNKKQEELYKLFNAAELLKSIQPNSYSKTIIDNLVNEIKERL